MLALPQLKCAPKEYSMPQSVLEMAKDLVMAQIAARQLSPDEMHQVLQQTYTSLKALQAHEEANGSVAVAHQRDHQS
jgi:predicted transcriptional regulator